MTVCAMLAFTGIAIVHCRADPTALSTNVPPPPPLDQLLSTNVALPLLSSNSPPLSLVPPPPATHGLRLAQPQMAPPTNLLTPESTVPWSGRRPGIYLSSPYAMQVKVPDDVDSGMTHSPSGNWNFDTPVHNPGMELKHP